MAWSWPRQAGERAGRDEAGGQGRAAPACIADGDRGGTPGLPADTAGSPGTIEPSSPSRRAHTVNPMTAQTIKEALTLIFQGIERLHEAFPSRAFTIDGRLVGDIGEVIAELEYDLALDEVSVRDHDAQMRNGRRVQIKADLQRQPDFHDMP